MDQGLVQILGVRGDEHGDGVVEDGDGPAAREPAVVEKSVDVGQFGADELGEVLSGIVLGIMQDVGGNAGAGRVGAGKVEQSEGVTRPRGDLERDMAGILPGLEDAVGRRSKRSRTIVS